jgi:breast cancer 2 susceptibility protein
VKSDTHILYQRKREVAASKLWSDLEKRASLMTGYAERLEQRVGPNFSVKNEGETTAVIKAAQRSRIATEMPDNLVDIYESLEESDANQAKPILSRLSRIEAGSLATFIREKLLRDREAVAEEIERELQVNLICA